MKAPYVHSRLAAATFAALSLLPIGYAGADEDKAQESWRLFIADHTEPEVRVFDLASGKLLDRYDLKGFAALAASATGQTVFAVQSDADAVHVLKSGIALSDHGEHRDIEISDPALLPQVLEGKRPVHAVMHGGEAVLFYDRAGRADVVSERALLDGKVEIRSFDATAPHHGVAVPMGKHMLISVPDTSADVKPDELLPRLGLRVVDQQGRQVGDVAPCTALHGEAVSAQLVAFGCEEGVLIARPGGSEGPQLEMLAYGDALPAGKVSTLLGGKAMQFFLGNFGEDKLVLIDPDSDAPYRLVELPVRRVDFALDPARVKNAYVFTEDGKLHLLNVLSGEIAKSVTVTEPYSKDGHWRDPRPRLAVAGDLIAVTNPRESRVHLIDIETMEEVRTIAVEGLPFNIVAVGGSGAVH